MRLSTVRMRRLPRLAVLLSIVALALAGCGTIDPTLDQGVQAGAAPTGRILFVRDGDVHLWDGDIQKITEVGDASSPTWSNNGNEFVFVRTWDAISDLYHGQLGNTEFWQLTHNQPDMQPGTKAFVDNAVWALDPDWSPVDNTIAYVSDQYSVKNFLWLMVGLGVEPIQVPASTYNGENVEDPDFSPDASQIVFAQRTSDDFGLLRWTDLWVVDVFSGELRPLVQGGEGNYDPAWSPQGDWISFVRRTGSANDLWVVPADGGEPTRLTDGKSIASPAWSPDGKTIAFIERSGDGFKVSYVDFSVGAEGQPQASDSKELFSAGGIDAASGLSWAP